MQHLWSKRLGSVLFVVLVSIQHSARPQDQVSNPGQSNPAVNEWTDTFDGAVLDSQKWELHSLEGGNGKVELKEGQLRMRGQNGWRAGVRTKQSFSGDRVYCRRDNCESRSSNA